MTLTLAIGLGLLFGFVLQKVGAANPQKIMGMLRLTDLHLMKAILFAIGFSSLGLFTLMLVGVIPIDHLSVKSAYIGVIVGGVLLGIGWAIAGFCPGTGLVALGAGRKDAVIFILGGLIGAFIYTLVYGAISDTSLFKSLGGKTTLAQTGHDSYPAVFSSISGLIIAGSIAVVFMLIAFLLPGRKDV